MSDVYNGYANYPTWATALWMDNEPASNEYLYDLANREPVHEAERVELLDKADQLKEYVVAMLLDDQPTGLRHDLLCHAMDVIDWREIVNSHIEERPLPPCTGNYEEGNPVYSVEHQGDTCPVHEKEKN